MISSISYFTGIHAVFIAWLIYSIIIYGNEAKKILSGKKYLLLLIFFVFYFMSMLYSVGLSLAFARTIALIEVFSPVLMYDFYKLNRWNNSKYPLWVMISIIIINMSLSFAMIEFMGRSGLRDTIQSDSDNIFKGALAIITSLAILVPTAFFVVLHFKQFKTKFKWVKLGLLIAFIVYGMLLLFNALFMTAIMTSIVGCVIALVYGTRKWLLKSSICVILIVFGFISYFGAIVDFTNSFGPSMKSFITPKLYEIKHILDGDSHSAVDMTARNSLAESSFNTFLDNPFFGVIHKAADFEETAKLGVGNHSEWLDDLALYGVFAFLIFSFLYRAGKEQFKRTKFLLSLLLFTFLGFNNPILNFQVIFTVFLLIPIFLEYIKTSNTYDRNSRSCI